MYSNITQLMSLGDFTKEECTDAYISCEKDVHAAANLLLDG
jgi:hypothetical protein